MSRVQCVDYGGYGGGRDGFGHTFHYAKDKGFRDFGEGDQQENSHIFFFIVMLKVWDFEGGSTKSPKE